MHTNAKRRRIEIERLHLLGLSQGKIAKRIDMTPRRVGEILRELGYRRDHREGPPPVFPGVPQLPDDVVDTIAKNELLLTDEQKQRAEIAIAAACEEFQRRNGWTYSPRRADDWSPRMAG